ncbi:MAG: DUF721 domain-containing protein [Planctomycetes bacterium]|nr:DUF721 domain-containing protein [Planctomycetota bacterium]
MRTEGPRRLGDYIRFFLRSSGLEKAVTKPDFHRSWEQALGDVRLIPHTRPGTVRSGILKVEVDAPVVMQELNFRRREIVKRLAELAPDARVKDIRFVIGNFRSPR